ncbi:hypothetical protein SAMN05444673_3726 [Bacillus sp. OV166]|uniref:hypothetical protein n=1 Tax=unclassified Bacillus (in: firmicutes) TaxID=185979 RepID=UPI000A2AD485|nr:MULTISPECIES: hypothetical protein [unclassified Bacillus (in: firmicutes)]PGY08140.1 hypothetical protein COE25_22710 [Bacillus sp. AFS031507]SMQ79588.1 hypothetical protein SAMN05444673_3726 [Bacillus sp. OV166]
MKFTIQYIPLNKIKPDLSVKITEHIKKLQRLMWDCMFVLVVKKNRKDDNYIIVSGQDRFESLKKHTKNIYAPCIVDKSRSSNGMISWLQRFRNKQPLDDFPLMPTSWSIVRSFLKQEPRFKHLSRSEQIRVLLIAVRYKKTVIYSMKTTVNEILRSKK